MTEKKDSEGVYAGLCWYSIELETQLFCEEGIAELLPKTIALKIDG